jgi:hypothetical protein
MQGVTDALINLVRARRGERGDWRDQLEALKKRHLDTAGELLARARRARRPSSRRTSPSSPTSSTRRRASAR